MNSYSYKKIHLIVVGSGGTGTYFLKEFSRFIAGGIQEIGKMTIIDGDTVEEKNCSRQAFAPEDVGQNKAAVMADILNSAFELNYEAVSDYLTELSQLKRLVTDNEIPVIIGCVDNHACRLLLEQYFDMKDTICYLDSANEFSTGEVVFSYKKDGKLVSPVRSVLFPDIKSADLRKRTDMSCEELNNVAPQHIATNMEAGNILLKEMCCILKGNAHPGMVTFDLDSFYQEYVPAKIASADLRTAAA